MTRKSLYKGPDQSKLDKFAVTIDSKDITLLYSELHMLKKDSLHASILMNLFQENSISRNDFRGYNSLDNLTLYYTNHGKKIIIVSLGEVSRGLYEVVFENVFDSEDQDDTIELLEYHKLTYSHKPEAMGIAFPQLVKIQGANAAEISEAQQMRSVAENYFDGKTFAAKLGALRTDFISTSFLAYAGFFISTKLGSLLPEQGETKHKVNIQYTNDIVEAQFLEFQLPQVNYPMSRFALRKADGMKIFKENIIDEATHKSESANAVLSDFTSKIVPVVLTIEKGLHFMKLAGEHSMLISGHIKKLLEDHELTGWESRSYKVDIFTVKPA